MIAHRRFATFWLSLPLGLCLLGALGCSAPKDNSALFRDGGETSAASASSGGSNGASAGTDSGSGASQSNGGMSSAAAGSHAGTASGGLGGNAMTLGGLGGIGAAGTSAGAGAAGQSMTGGSGGGQAKGVESCDMVDGAVTNEQNGHCYRINSDELTFVAAVAACEAAAGHLVTLGDKAEDDFVRHLLDASHWIGASDGRSDRTPGTAPFSWIDGEPWDYSNWESGQPNAVATDCPDEAGGAHCYEHCAFQASGGSWNDRACFHMIASICEWEPVAK